MLVGNRLVRIIFGTFILILLILNLHYFLWSQEVKESTGQVVNHFHGFNWFFTRVGEFPGIDSLVEFIKSLPDFFDWNGIVKNFTSGKFDDTLLAILKFIGLAFKAMTVPILFVGCLAWTVAENVIWLFSFIFDYFPAIRN